MAGRGGIDAYLCLLDEAFRSGGMLMTNWGEKRPTRWIVAAMVTHDAYHAGEINHVRSLLAGDDRWRHVQQGFG